MTNGHKLTWALALALALGVCYTIYGWTSEHIAAAVLSAQTRANQDAQKAIAANEAANQSKLAAATQANAALKAQGQTTPQIIKLVPQIIQLPAAPSQVSAQQAQAINAASLPDAPKVHAGDVIVPQSDVKPMFDAAVSCKQFKDDLESCRVTVANKEATIAVNDKQIAQDHVALNGGTKMHRVLRALKWTAAIAATGYVSYKAGQLSR